MRSALSNTLSQFVSPILVLRQRLCDAHAAVHLRLLHPCKLNAKLGELRLMRWLHVALELGPVATCKARCS